MIGSTVICIDKMKSIKKTAKKDDIWGEPDKMDNFFKEDDDWIDDMY